MTRKRYKPKEIVSLLRRAAVLHGQGMSMVDASRQLGSSDVTYCRWCRKYGRMSGDQLRRLNELEKANERLRRAGKLLSASRRRQCIDHVRVRLGISAAPGLEDKPHRRCSTAVHSRASWQATSM